MLIAINQDTGQLIGIEEYAALPEKERPYLRCAGRPVDGPACEAVPVACALNSEKVHPYFRVPDSTTHVKGCSHGSVLDQIEARAQEQREGRSPRGPEIVVSLKIEQQGATPNLNYRVDDVENKDESARTRQQVHQSKSPVRLNTPLRELAYMHASGKLPDSTQVQASGMNFVVGDAYMHCADLSPAYRSNKRVFTYGSIFAIWSGDVEGYRFIRFADSSGGPSQEIIMIAPNLFPALAKQIEIVMEDPAGWIVAVVGTMGTQRKNKLEPYESWAIEFERSERFSSAVAR